LKCSMRRGPGSFDVEDATTLSWSSAAVSEWVTFIQFKICCCVLDFTKIRWFFPNNSTKQLVTRVNSTHHRHIQLHILDVILDIDSAQFTTASRRSVRVKTRGTYEWNWVTVDETASDISRHDLQHTIITIIIINIDSMSDPPLQIFL